MKRRATANEEIQSWCVRARVCVCVCVCVCMHEDILAGPHNLLIRLGFKAGVRGYLL